MIDEERIRNSLSNDINRNLMQLEKENKALWNICKLMAYRCLSTDTSKRSDGLKIVTIMTLLKCNKRTAIRYNKALQTLRMSQNLGNLCVQDLRRKRLQVKLEEVYA